MTTQADVKRLVAPILERNPDLALAGRLVVITPVRHIVRGVFVDRTGSKESLNPHWFAGLLGDNRSSLALTFGSTYFPQQEPRFHTSNPHLEEDLRAAIEDFALPTLRPVQTIADFQRYATDGPVPYVNLYHHPFTKVCVDVALGDFESALAICEDISAREAVYRKLKYDDELHMIALLHPLVLAKDIKALASWLHQWEEKAVKRLKLTPYWRPSPFPIEEM